jgi:hypothetical protein
MKNITEYMMEHLEDYNEAKETIDSEKELRSAMEAKFKEVFKDDLDKEKMNKTIDGFCKDHSKEIEDGKFGELIGEFNKSFTK